MAPLLKGIKTPFKDFNIKHKLFVMAVGLLVMVISASAYSLYIVRHPEQEVIAGIVTAAVTFIVLLSVMVIMTLKFQKEYNSDGQRRR